MSKRKGQNIAEYSILIALVIAAAVAMQVYVKRGIQGRVADAVDYAPTLSIMNVAVNVGATKQYEPYYQREDSTASSDFGYSEALGERGQTTRSGVTQSQTRAQSSYTAQLWNSFNTR
jgi:hypothetical protein